MPTLPDILGEGRARHHQRVGLCEACPAIVRAVRKDRIVPAAEVPADAAPAVLVGMILVMHQRADGPSVPGPGGGNEVAIRVMRGLGIERAIERDMTIDGEMLEIGAAQRAVDEVQGEQVYAAAAIAVRARIDIRDIVGVTAVTRRIEDDRRLALQRQREIGGFSLCRQRRHQHQSEPTDPHDSLQSGPQSNAAQYAFLAEIRTKGVTRRT